MEWLGSNYNFRPYRENPGLEQKWELRFWPDKIRKKGAELIWTSVVEQVLLVTPTIIYGKVVSANANQWQPSPPINNQHTWNPGAAPTYPNIAKRGHEDDPNCYTHGYRSVYNFNGILIYVTGTFTSALLSEVKAKLSPFAPAASIIGFFVNNEPVFYLKAEEGDGSVHW